MKNCEYALSKGCATVRDSGGAYDMVDGLKKDILSATNPSKVSMEGKCLIDNVE